MDKEITSQNNQSLKIQLSLASLMFFSPLVQLMLKKSTFEISQSDVNFVGGYMKLGWICILLLALSLGFTGLDYFYSVSLLETGYTISMILLIVVLVLGCIGIFTDSSLIKDSSKSTGFTLQTIEGDKKDMLLHYLPLYNIYYRYFIHSFDKPNLILKESFLIRGLFALACLFGNILVVTIVLVLIIIRIVTLMSNINIIPEKITDTIHTLYYKNPEELWGYVAGSIYYLVCSITNKPISLSESISTYKRPYTYLYDIRKFGNIQTQYILSLVILILAHIQRNILPSTSLGYIAWGLLLSRYILMVVVWKHVPSLPGIRELVSIFSPLKEKTNK